MYIFFFIFIFYILINLSTYCFIDLLVYMHIANMVDGSIHFDASIQFDDSIQLERPPQQRSVRALAPREGRAPQGACLPQ